MYYLQSWEYKIQKKENRHSLPIGILHSDKRQAINTKKLSRVMISGYKSTI